MADERPPLELPDVLEDVRRALPDGSAVWLVGGAIRDALLGRRIRDLDFAVDGDGIRLARWVADRMNAPFYPLDPERGIGRVILARDDGRFTLDFGRLRGADLAADLAGRDFTINAIAAGLAQPDQLIDPLGGEADIRAKLIRACARSSIADDPVRAVRAIRLAAQLDFHIDKATRDEIRAQSGRLAQVSAERRRDEFIRCLGGPRAGAALRALDVMRLLDAMLPELAELKGVTQPPPHVYDVWEHTVMVVARLDDILRVLHPVHDVDAASDLTLGLVSVRLGRYREALAEHLNRMISADRPVRWLLMMAALLHDIGKARTRSVEPNGRIRFFNHERAGADIAVRRLSELRFSSGEVRRARSIVVHHMRPLHLAQQDRVSRRAIYRFFRDAGEAGVDIALLSLADTLGKYGDSPPPQDRWARHVDVAASLLGAYFERPEESIRPPSLLNGDDLMATFGLEAGPRVGELLEALREAQAAGEVPDRAAALDYVRRHLGR